MSRAVLILGATSAIGRETANLFAADGRPVFLAGRDAEELERIASDITIRFNVPTSFGVFDAEACETHDRFFLKAVRKMSGIDGVLLAFGDLGSQPKAIKDFSEAHKILNRNLIGACSILTHCANYLESKGSGFIIGISSVAGDRGRQSNYLYGTAKGGLTLFLQGLRNRLYSEGVRVITVKPGFVDTGMTYGLPGMFLVASPQKIAKSIVNTLSHSRDVIYTPWFWRPIMFIIKSIPEFIFKRLKL